MRMSTTRRASLLLALLLAAVAVSAPAPVYKERPSLGSAHRALPEALRYDIDSFYRSLPEFIERSERNLRLARTQREIRLSGIEVLKAEFYRHPIELLEYQRRQPPYQSREDQRKIEEALKFYRLQYHEAKQKGILVEPRGMVPLK
jgi:hypothetical protein